MDGHMDRYQWVAAKKHRVTMAQKHRTPRISLHWSPTQLDTHVSLVSLSSILGSLQLKWTFELFKTRLSVYPPFALPVCLCSLT
uniref:Uncharacterized protein n=1 Tax=Steinernema glaseri TaxID=37863 RepID=A0A1I7Y6R8_9BILA